ADALLCGVGPPVVGERLALALGVGGEAAAVLVQVGEGVVEVGEPLGLPGGLQRLDQEVLVVGAPLGEVADLAVGVLGAAAVARRAVHRAGDRFGGAAGEHPVVAEGVAAPGGHL